MSTHHVQYFSISEFVQPKLENLCGKTMGELPAEFSVESCFLIRNTTDVLGR